MGSLAPATPKYAAQNLADLILFTACRIASSKFFRTVNSELSLGLMGPLKPRPNIRPEASQMSARV